MGSFWSRGQTFQPPVSACGVALFHVPKRPSHPCYPSGKDELARSGHRSWRTGWQGLGQPHTIPATAILLCG